MLIPRLPEGWQVGDPLPPEIEAISDAAALRSMERAAEWGLGSTVGDHAATVADPYTDLLLDCKTHGKWSKLKGLLE